MLASRRECSSCLSTHLERPGHGGLVSAAPHLLHQAAERSGDLAPHAERVVCVELLQMAVLQEVVGERRRVGETLEH